MSTDTQICEIAIPGYVLTERIGSGGYAEVWRAEAPGGIAKAVKIVYGRYDDEFASQELKALERIKVVRHPFLLSLERFETVNGRLAILTELADMCLEQRLRECRADGLPGIPRDELLRYMADAAEALDFLSQRHNLLHLDIKPENLLILGEHIKVADFGLVKELASRTQNSLVSGMTPAYAAPEMFDDEPSAQSDQYSLAIVYQEMLVGVLPFPGRTAAQLAKQHMQAEPLLMSLPVGDRPAIARALAKNPSDRFPTCRAFVDAISRGSNSSPFEPPTATPRPIPVTLFPPIPSPDDTKPQSLCATLPRTTEAPSEQREAVVTQPVRRAVLPAGEVQSEAPPAPTTVVREEIIDIAAPEFNTILACEQPTLYVAIGGLGIQTLCRLRGSMSAGDEGGSARKAIGAIGIDTDRGELREACSNRWKAPLEPHDTMHLPLRLPKSYDDSLDINGWVSRRWLYNIPRSLETRGYRPLGRVALVDHSHRVIDLFDQKLQQLSTETSSIEAGTDAPSSVIKISLLVGTGGGTGSGMVIDVANLIKSLAAARNLHIEVHGYFICNCFANNNSAPLVAANTYALLTELNHVTALGNESNGDKAAHVHRFESREAPFDYVYWVPMFSRKADGGQIDSLEAIAQYLACQRLSGVRAAIRACRESKTPREQRCVQTLTIRKPGIASLTEQKRSFLSALAIELADAVKRHWLTRDNSADWERLVLGEQQTSSTLKPGATSEGESLDMAALAPRRDVTSISLRGRFREHMSFVVASEVLRQIQHQLESRDDRGRPLISSNDANLIADTARAAIASLAMSMQCETNDLSRIAKSVPLRTLVTACSRRVLSRAVEHFDLKQPERFLAADELEDLIKSECQVLLEESLAQPELAPAIDAHIELDQVLSRTLECSTMDLLQCGSDRRTLLFVAASETQGASIDKLRTMRPLAAVVPVEIDDLLVISEESGISPRSLALGLERVFPGIADAARRLHTRIDIEWDSLI